MAIMVIALLGKALIGNSPYVKWTFENSPFGNWPLWETTIFGTAFLGNDPFMKWPFWDGPNVKRSFWEWPLKKLPFWEESFGIGYSGNGPYGKRPF